MPRYVALEWGRAGIRGLAADVSGGAVRVSGSLMHDWPQDFDAASDARQLGSWLKARIDEADGVGDAPLVVVVSREVVTLRLLALPAASEDSVADLVQYQTRARSSVPLEQLVWDYVPLNTSPPQGGRWVQAATVPARLLQHIKSSVEAAGLELRSVGVSSLALGEAVVRQAAMAEFPAEQHSLVVRAVGEQLEVGLWRGSDLLLGHMARAADAKAALVEVQRALMSHQGVADADGVGHVWLMAAGAHLEELKEGLAARLDCQVTAIDPRRDVLPPSAATDRQDDAARFMAAWGALQATRQVTLPTIDFLHPRRRPVQRDRTKLVVGLLAGVLLLALAGVYLGTRFYVKSLDERIADKARQVQRGEEAWQESEPARDAADFFASWQNQHIDWLVQMNRIGGVLPGTERVYLDRWRFDRGGNVVLGTTEAHGFARQREDARGLTERLADQLGLRIRPNPYQSTDGNGDYPILFQLNAEIVKPPASGRQKAL